ncbi:MAG: hypothetical protein AAB267_09655 [Candidatus Desantisbacteria bacterium]
MKKKAFKVYFSAITACSQKVGEKARINEATIAGTTLGIGDWGLGISFRG